MNPIDRLFALPPRKTKDLSVLKALDARLGYPHASFAAIHVAGTNGKGSVATKIAKALEAAGRRVGLYTSPHILDVCERIQINGQKIPQEILTSLLDQIFSLPYGNLASFDILTLASFLYFRQERVDFAVIEAGIGGRFDATNLIASKLAVITSIGYDHMDLLGSTLEEIAHEKGGIAKGDTPLIVGPTAAPFFPNAITTPRAPFFDLENQAIARKALEVLGVSPDAIETGLKKRPPCRFERRQCRGCDCILDVAHNIDGFKKLIEALHLHFPNQKYHFIVAFSKTKDWKPCLDLVRQETSLITAPLVSNARLEDPAILQAYVPELAIGINLKPNCLNVICGSFYIMDQFFE